MCADGKKSLCNLCFYFYLTSRHWLEFLSGSFAKLQVLHLKNNNSQCFTCDPVIRL